MCDLVVPEYLYILNVTVSLYDSIKIKLQPVCTLNDTHPRLNTYHLHEGTVFLCFTLKIRLKKHAGSESSFFLSSLNSREFDLGRSLPPTGRWDKLMKTCPWTKDKKKKVCSSAESKVFRIQRWDKTAPTESFKNKTHFEWNSIYLFFFLTQGSSRAGRGASA